MNRDVSLAGAVRYRLVIAELLMGSLAGCGVSSRTKPQPPAPRSRRFLFQTYPMRCSNSLRRMPNARRWWERWPAR